MLISKITCFVVCALLLVVACLMFVALILMLISFIKDLAYTILKERRKQ